MSFDPDRERGWLRRITAGDRPAFEELYHAYHRKLLAYLFRMTGSGDLADELTSDVLLEVWKSAGKFKGDSRPSTWIFGIARHKALSAIRRSQPSTVDIEEVPELPDAGEPQDAMLISEDMKVEVREALSALSPAHREVMELTFYQGFSYPEIAEILDCPVNTVKTRMFHARKQLCVRLEALKTS